MRHPDHPRHQPGARTRRTAPAGSRTRRRLRHRGPDWSGVYSDERAISRTSACRSSTSSTARSRSSTELTAPSSRSTARSTTTRTCARSSRRPHDFQTLSDCEVAALPLRRVRAARLPQPDQRHLRASSLYDPRAGRYFIARDPIGVNPLYVGWDRDERHLRRVGDEGARRALRTDPRVPARATTTWATEADKGFQRYYEPAWAEPGVRARRSRTTRPAARGARGRRAPPADVRRALRRAHLRRRRLVDHRGHRRAATPSGASRTDDQSPAWWPRHALVLDRPEGGARSRPRRGWWPSAIGSHAPRDPLHRAGGARRAAAT